MPHLDFWQILIILTLSFWTGFAICALVYVIWSHYYKLPISSDDDNYQTTEIRTRMEVQKRPNEVVFYEERNERSREEMIYI